LVASIAPRAGAVQQAQAPAAPPDELHVTLLHTSDEHSALLPTPFVEYAAGDRSATRGGFARLASVVEAERARKAAAGEPVLLTSAGDNLTGTAFGWLALRGEAPELGLMVRLGYDVITLGNHEFDYGSERLAAYIAAAGFPAAAARTAIVASNTMPPGGHPLTELGIRRTHLVELPNGLRVGFLGLIGRGAARYATMAAPVEFGDAHGAAAAAVEALRAAGAHIVVALTHSGLEEDRALARAVPGIDVVLGGHDHRLLEAPVVEGGTPIVHPGAHLQQVARVELAYSPATGAVRLRNAETGAPPLIPLDVSVPEREWAAAAVAEHRARLEGWIGELTAGRVTALGQPVVYSAFTLPAGPPLRETGLGNLVTDAMRAAAEAATGERVDFVFQANGVIRGDLVPGAAGAVRGAVTAYDLARVVGMGAGPDGLPGYPLVSLRLTGAEVRSALEVSVLLSGLMGNSYFLQVSGLRAAYDPARAVWLRLPVRGTPLPAGRALLSAEREADAGWLPLERGDTALYHVVTDRYVASFLPMVGRVVPRFEIAPKDAAGAPLAEIDAAIVRRDGRELKVWQAVLEHLAAGPPVADGRQWIDARYAAPEGRLVQQRGTPLLLLPAVAVALLLALAIGLLLRRRRGRAAAGPATTPPPGPTARTPGVGSAG
jgi:5'-nucleotidase / UDP-sugar diphosphatase